jgi:hypothetical protein
MVCAIFILRLEPLRFFSMHIHRPVFLAALDFSKGFDDIHLRVAIRRVGVTEYCVEPNVRLGNV